MAAATISADGEVTTVDMRSVLSVAGTVTVSPTEDCIPLFVTEVGVWGGTAS